MNKTNILQIMINLIFIVIFNIVFFVTGGTDHNTSVWISYGFIHFAYLMLLITPFLVRKGKSSAVFGLSLYAISLIYFIAAFVTGVIFIWLSQDGYELTLLVQLCVAGAYGIVLATNLIANERTADAEEGRQHRIAFIKDASMRMKILMGKAQNEKAKKKLEKVYDALRSSPVKSYPELKQTENGILHSIDELENALAAGKEDTVLSLARSILGAINERNMRLKKLNH